MVGRKGVSAIEISVLLFLIAVGMIGYVILLPASERDALLSDEGLSTNTEDSTNVLLSESPGELQSSKSTSQQRELESMRLYSTTESNTKTLAPSLTISRNPVQNNYKVVTFNIDNFEEFESASLLFLVRENKGDLNIELNGNMIYEGDVSGSDLPIELPIDYLNETGNTLKLYTDWTLNVFSPNYYLLQDIQLVEDYTVADLVSTRTFSVDDPSTVTSAVLTYYISCNSEEEGVLTISLNDREMFSDSVYCDYLNKRELELDEEELDDFNTLKFEINKGDYNIEKAEITIKSKNKVYPTFTFNVDSDLYDNVIDGEDDIYLKLTFADDTSEKSGSVYVNGYSYDFDTSDETTKKKISAYITEGSNKISLQGSNTFDVDNLKVYVA